MCSASGSYGRLADEMWILKSLKFPIRILNYLDFFV